MAAKTIDANWIKARVSDELGLTEDDLARLYSIEPNAVNKHLSTLGGDSQTIYDQVPSDVDTMRIGYRQVKVSDRQNATIRNRLRAYLFHPRDSIPPANGQIGGSPSGYDA